MTSHSDIQAYHIAATGLHSEDMVVNDAHATLLCNVSNGQPRPMVPMGWRCCVIDAIRALFQCG